MIVAIGNSHAHVFTGGHPACESYAEQNFVSISIGPIIAYNFKQHHLSKVERIVKSLLDNTLVILVVGEVDCRWHIPKQAELQKRSIEDVTNEVVDRYFEGVLDTKKIHDKVACFGVHPTTLGGHSDNPDQPVYGNWQTRNATCVAFNKRLQNLCEKNGVGFITIYDKLVDEENKTREEFYMDYCHLNHKLVIDMINEALGVKS